MNKKLILAFPGQGSQYIGMNKIPRSILGDKFVDDTWEQVNDALGYDLKTIVEAGPADQLTLTQNTQPALVVTSYLFFEIFKQNFPNQKIDLVLGHSLGEYSALLAAGVFNLSDGVKITHLRGKYMQEAVPAGLGSMIAILKCPKDQVKHACEIASTETEKVTIANDNSPEQVVISGHASACNKAVEWLQANVKERFRAIPLQVSAPFHSPLMAPAAEKLKAALNNIKLNSNQFSYVSNVDASVNLEQTQVQIIRNKLVSQVCGTVKWVDCCFKMIEPAHILEVGPGAVLAGLIKKIHLESKVFSMDQENCLSLLTSYLVES